MKVGFAEKMAKTTATIIVDASTFKMDMMMSFPYKSHGILREAWEKFNRSQL